MNQEDNVSASQDAAKLTEAAKPDTPVKVVVVEQPGGVQHTYANHIVLSYTSHDVQLWFSQLSRLPEITPSGEPTNRVEQRCVVTLSWSEAKACRDVLSDTIKKFEGFNGEINITPRIS